MQDRATATRARLITAAAQLINDVGLESASVDKISCRALVSKGAFYFHFPSKDHLLGALIAAPSPSPKLRCK